MPRTSKLHLRKHDALETRAKAKLTGVGLTVSVTLRVRLTRVVGEDGLVPDLADDPAARDARFSAKVHATLAVAQPAVSPGEVIGDEQAKPQRR